MLAFARRRVNCLAWHSVQSNSPVTLDLCCILSPRAERTRYSSAAGEILHPEFVSCSISRDRVYGGAGGFPVPACDGPLSARSRLSWKLGADRPGGRTMEMVDAARRPGPCASVNVVAKRLCDWIASSCAQRWKDHAHADSCQSEDRTILLISCLSRAFPAKRPFLASDERDPCKSVLSAVLPHTCRSTSRLAFYRWGVRNLPRWTQVFILDPSPIGQFTSQGHWPGQDQTQARAPTLR